MSGMLSEAMGGNQSLGAAICTGRLEEHDTVL